MYSVILGGEVLPVAFSAEISAERQAELYNGLMHSTVLERLAMLADDNLRRQAFYAMVRVVVRKELGRRNPVQYVLRRSRNPSAIGDSQAE